MNALNLQCLCSLWKRITDQFKQGSKFLYGGISTFQGNSFFPLKPKLVILHNKIYSTKPGDYCKHCKSYKLSHHIYKTCFFLYTFVMSMFKMQICWQIGNQNSNNDNATRNNKNRQILQEKVKWLMHAKLNYIKVARVVKLKLAFMESFFYNLVMLIKLYKIRYLDLDKALLFPRNQAICLKNWKLWQAPTTTKFNIFCWNFAQVSYLTMSTNVVQDFCYFV